MSKLVWGRFCMPIALLGVAALFLGCSNSETVPLKKVDFIYDIKEKKVQDLPKNLQGGKGTSSGMKRDPSGMHPNG
jgi:hypothetical protein